MDRLKRTVLCGVCVLLMSFGVSAQREVRVKGEYNYAQGESDTPKKAELTAIRKAQINALEEEFGTLIEQTNLTVVEGGKSEFHSLSMSDVRGEWLKDLKPAEVTKTLGEDDVVYYNAKVWGLAREIVTAPIDLDVKLLRNEVDERFESSEFLHMDQCFMSFRSPVDGYLAVYLMDENYVSARMLPYKNTSDKSYKIKSNTDYVFFNTKKPNAGDHFIDDYQFATDKNVEYCRLYVIFSTNEFTHPMEQDGGSVKYGNAEYSKLMEVDYKHMQDWLGKSRSRDKHMQVIRKDITIRKK